MHIRLMAIVLAGVTISACVTPYKSVDNGPKLIGSLSLDVSSQWNEVPASQVANERTGTKVWTQHGELLDRFILIPDIPSGEPVFISKNNYLNMPDFRTGMLPNEIEDLVESSMLKYLGESSAVVETSNLRPKRFPDDQLGFMFDIQYELSEGPRYLGTVGSFESNERLYLLIYLAATPYYYETYVDDALAVMDTVRIDEAGGVEAALAACGNSKRCQKRVKSGS